MNAFFRDLLAVLRLRYRALDEYRYPKIVYAVVLALCAVSSAAVMQWGMSADDNYPLKFTGVGALVAFCLCTVVVQWWCLSFVLSKLLKQFGAAEVPLWGYMLLTQSFTMFEVAFVYLPGDWLLIASLFQMWTFWVQLYGLFFIAARDISGWKVLLSYVLSIVTSGIIMMAVMMGFLATGQIDSTQLQQQIYEILQQQQQELQKQQQP